MLPRNQILNVDRKHAVMIFMKRSAGTFRFISF